MECYNGTHQHELDHCANTAKWQDAFEFDLRISEEEANWQNAFVFAGIEEKNEKLQSEDYELKEYDIRDLIVFDFVDSECKVAQELVNDELCTKQLENDGKEDADKPDSDSKVEELTTGKKLNDSNQPEVALQKAREMDEVLHENSNWVKQEADVIESNIEADRLTLCNALSDDDKIVVNSRKADKYSDCEVSEMLNAKKTPDNQKKALKNCLSTNSAKEDADSQLYEVLQHIPRIENDLRQIGFAKVNVGEKRNIDYNRDYDLYIRREKVVQQMEKIKCKADDKIKMSSLKKAVTPCGMGDCENLTNKDMGKANEIMSEMNLKVPRNPRELRSPSTSQQQNIQHEYKNNHQLNHKGNDYNQSQYIEQPQLLTEGGGPDNINITSHEKDENSNRLDYLPELTKLNEFESIKGLQSNCKSSIVISYSCSKYKKTKSNQFEPITWNFVVIYGIEIFEFVFVRKTKRGLLNLELALARICDELGMNPISVRTTRKYVARVKNRKGKIVEKKYATRDLAEKESVESFPDGKTIHICPYDVSKSECFSITLLCHAGKRDIPFLNQGAAKSIDIIGNCEDIQGGLVMKDKVSVTLDSVKPELKSNSYFYQVDLSVSDTVCHAPDDYKKISDLAETMNIKQIQLYENENDKMNLLLERDAKKFIEYGVRKCEISLLYAASLYGYNVTLPMTITAAAASCIKDAIYEFMECSDNKDFNCKYRGSIENYNYKNKTKSLQQINRAAKQVWEAATEAYHGGCALAPKVGYFPKMTYDIDAIWAYAICVCLVPDIEWENPIVTSIEQRLMVESDFLDENGKWNPIPMMLCCVDITFPENVAFPCMAVKYEVPSKKDEAFEETKHNYEINTSSESGALIFVSSSDGIDGVMMTGPDLALAYKLGAKIFIKSGIILNVKKDENGNTSYSMRAAMKELIKDRAKAQKICGKKSLEDLILKLIINSCVGKISQEVISKGKEGRGTSPITNSVNAAFTTSIMRSVLLAAMNQVTDAGDEVYSCTTDGFITTMPEDKLNELDLYGLRDIMQHMREELEGPGAKVWAKKHEQSDLVNLRITGNISLEQGGVCARCGVHSPYKKGSFEDRNWFLGLVLNRRKVVEFDIEKMTTMRDLIRGTKLESGVRKTTKSVDYDMKRKPVESSLEERKLEFEGKEYGIPTFTTVPFRTIAEYEKYKRKANNMSLKTVDDYKTFFTESDVIPRYNKTTDTNWTKINSCIKGHFAGMWNIPILDQKNRISAQKIADKLNETFPECTHQIKAGDIYTAKSAKNRYSSILPKNEIEEILFILQGISIEDMKE